MVIRAVIWDLGGVLLRTEDHSHRKKLAEMLGIPDGKIEFFVFDSESSRKSQLGLIGIDDHWDYVRKELKLSSQEMPEFRRKFWAGDVLDIQLVEYIRGLRQSGLKTGLLSNAFPETRRFLEEQQKVADIFDQIIISSEEGVMKPDGRIYQIAVDRLSVEHSEAVFIDDSAQNVAGARNTGLHAIHFANPEQVRRDLNRLLERDTYE